MKDIDTETRNNTVADDVTAGEDMAVERGVKLTRPIERGGEKITYVEITGAIEQAGSLRGLSLSDVLNLKADTMFTLLPRVTSPRLDEVMIKKNVVTRFYSVVRSGCKFYERARLWREERAGDGSVITLVCFEHIEDRVAEIAAIFNWSPAEIFMMTPGEVVSWRERAALRSGNADNEDS